MKATIRRRSRSSNDERRVRGAVRLSFCRLRQPPPQERDCPDPARTARALTRTGAGHGRQRVSGDRGGSVASLLALDPYVTDWLNLLTRWLHVIAGDRLDRLVVLLHRTRQPPPAAGGRARTGVGIGGETWEIHGGGFYRIKKYLVAPRVLPETLHWYKWEAYTTWLSGFALMSSSTTSTPTRTWSTRASPTLDRRGGRASASACWPLALAGVRRALPPARRARPLVARVVVLR